MEEKEVFGKRSFVNELPEGDVPLAPLVKPLALGDCEGNEREVVPKDGSLPRGLAAVKSAVTLGKEEG